MVFTDSEFYKTPYRQFLTITWNQEDVERAITNPELLPMEFAQKGVADKIVRIIYSCTPEQKKAINTSQIEKALYEAGAFWKSDIAMDKLEGANRTELSKFDDPETNLIGQRSRKLFKSGIYHEDLMLFQIIFVAIRAVENTHRSFFTHEWQHKYARREERCRNQEVQTRTREVKNASRRSDCTWRARVISN